MATWVKDSTMGGWGPELPSRDQLVSLVLEAERNNVHRVHVLNASSCSKIDLRWPCVIRGVSTDWDCMTWSRKDVISKIGDVDVPWRPCFGDWHHQPGPDAPSAVSIMDYLGSTSSRPGVLFDQDDPELHAHAKLRAFYDVPPMLALIHEHRESTIPVISVACCNTGVGFHSHAENWLAQVMGRKLWWVVPPGNKYAFGEATLKQSAPWRYLLPDQHPPGSLFCVLHPGDVLYLPEDCLHATWNVDDCCVSLGQIGVRNDLAATAAEQLVDADVAYASGLQSEAAGDLNAAIESYRCAAKGHHASAMHKLWRLSRRMGGSAELKWLQTAAEHGDVAAQVDLGDELCKGLSAPPDLKSVAASWYAAAALQKHPGGQHRMALVYMQSGDRVKGAALLEESAEQGWADAQTELGRRAQQSGAEAEARSWFEKAAGHGHPIAMNQLAILEARAGAHSAAKAWLQAAAERGHRVAMSNLAIYLEKGIGCAQDPAGAAEWRRRSQGQ